MATRKVPNLLALARRDKLVSFIHPKPGYVLLSSDGTAMEPTVTSALSGDRLYTYAAIEGIGKPLKYSGDILMIPDIYMMVASVSPAGAKAVKDHIESVGGMEAFSNQYLADKDAAIKPLKKVRTIHKVIALATGYGARPKKIFQVLTEGGNDVTFEQCEAVYETYWSLFKKLAQFKAMLERKVKRDGFLVNPFGYRGTPHWKDAYNFTIQSSVNPILTLYENYLLDPNPSWKYVCRIHDELLIQVPEGEVVRISEEIKRAEGLVNADLGWDIQVRFGMAIGNNMLEAK